MYRMDYAYYARKYAQNLAGIAVAAARDDDFGHLHDDVSQSRSGVHVPLISDHIRSRVASVFA